MARRQVWVGERVTRRRAAGGTWRAVARSERVWTWARETVKIVIDGVGGVAWSWSWDER